MIRTTNKESLVWEVGGWSFICTPSTTN